jgi:tripartite-type tricarboxylate transporter receptor subunit TctC
MRKALATPEIVRMFNERGIEIAVSSPEEFAAHLKKENERWAGVVRERGMRAE